MDAYAFFTVFAGTLYVMMAAYFFLFKRRVSEKLFYAATFILLAILAISWFLIANTDHRETQVLLYRIAFSAWILYPVMRFALAIPYSQQYAGTIRLVLFWFLAPVSVILLAWLHWNPLSMLNINPEVPVYTLDSQCFWPYLAGLFYLVSGITGTWLIIKLNQPIYPYVSKRQRMHALSLTIPIPLFYLVVLYFDIIRPHMGIAQTLSVLHLIGLAPAIGIFYSFAREGNSNNDLEELSGLFIQKIRQMMLFLDHQGKVVYANPFGASMLNLPVHKVAGQPVESYFARPYQIRKQINMAGYAAPDRREVQYLLPANTKPIPCMVNVFRLTDNMYKKAGYVLIGHDVREQVDLQRRIRERIQVESTLQQMKQNMEKRIRIRRQELSGAGQLLEQEVEQHRKVENKLRQELALKEEMLREIHHRVKNNIQMVVSLINMLDSDPSSAEELRAFQANLAKRAREVSYIHDYFYDLPSMGKVNFKHFITKTARELKSRHPNGKQVHFEWRVTEKPLVVDQAISCGIVVYELILNALQHAFPPTAQEGKPIWAQSTVNIHFDALDQVFRLNVVDNGIGIGLTDKSPVNEGMGLHLVQTIVKEDLHGNILYDNANGTSIEIRFQQVVPENS